MAQYYQQLEGLKTIYKPRKGYVAVSTAYPEGVPRSYGSAGGDAILMAKIARNTGGIASRFSPAEVAYAIECSDPRNTPLGEQIGVSSFRFPRIEPAAFTTGTSAQRATLAAAHEARVTAGTTASRTAGTGIAGGGTALARGGPAVGVQPGAGLDLGLGIGSSLSNVGSGIMNTVTSYIPLAIKLVLLFIGIKAVLWLMRGRR